MAKLIGADATIADDLMAALTDEFSPVAETLSAHRALPARDRGPSRRQSPNDFVGDGWAGVTAKQRRLAEPLFKRNGVPHPMSARRSKIESIEAIRSLSADELDRLGGELDVMRVQSEP
jgi:hypothetical protein